MSSLNDTTANKLNRELLRWIQSLDLAYSIKNVKRDFSNGFLVAEILSRYYDKDISMHSYDNAIGLKAKKDNWEQLYKVFTRISPDLDPLTSKTEIDAVIHCQNGAAVAYISKLYQCLTKRSIPSTVLPSISNGNQLPPPSSLGDIPPYAKPTGTAVIREKLRNADLAELNDESQLNRRVRGIHAQYEENLQLDRLIAMEAPDRYPTLRSANKTTILRGATKPVCNDETSAIVSTTQVVKEVHIRAMNEKGLEKLRVTREAKEQDNHSNGSNASLTRGVCALDMIQKRKPLDLLNEAVANKLSTTQLSQLHVRGKDKFEAFLEAVHDGTVFSTEQEAATLLREIIVGGESDEMCSVLAQSFLDTPRDFWKVTGLLFDFLTENEEEHVLFTCVHHGLVQLGYQCVERDASGAMVLLTDYILPRFPIILANFASKRAPLLQVMYAFVPETILAHIQAIKRMREAMSNDIPLFIHTLSILLYMEKQLDDTLIDLYYYYCGMGLETSCEKLRAACLSMLVPFLQYNITLVADLLPRLSQYASRHAWWEVKTQLVLIASAILYSVATTTSEQDYTETIELALTIIEREFHPRGNLNIRRIGLSYLAKNLGHYHELVALYVDVLLSLPPDVRALMLQNSRENVLPIRGTSGGHYSLQPLASQWDSIAIAKQIFYERKTCEKADFDSLQIIEHCFRQLETVNAQDQIRTLYEQMQGYIVLGLVDVNGCLPTSTIILIAARAGVTDIFSQEIMIHALQKIVTSNIDDIRQQSAVKLFQQVRLISSNHNVMLQSSLATLQDKSDATAFKASLFSKAMA